MKEKIAFIGCGNMGEALLKGIIRKGIIKKKQIVVSDINAKKLTYIKKTYRIDTTLSNEYAVKISDVIILCTKPQDIQTALEGLKSRLENKLVISIAAGITIAFLRKNTSARRIIRAMPNTPAIVGYGVTVIACAKEADLSDINVADRIFRCVGEVIHLDERFINAVTAVSGSGPAYFFFLMEAMIKAAVSLGIKKEAAEKLVTQTAFGSALLQRNTKSHPLILRKKVTSKGGTTEAAINVFNKKNLERTIKDAIASACKRSKELSG